MKCWCKDGTSGSNIFLIQEHGFRIGKKNNNHKVAWYDEEELEYPDYEEAVIKHNFQKQKKILFLWWQEEI